MIVLPPARNGGARLGVRIRRRMRRRKAHVAWRKR
jgi:hypothetical protein